MQLAESGASAQHNPWSNLMLGSGVAPVRALLDFPKRPDSREQQENHHGQKQPCQIRSGERRQHHRNNAIAVPKSQRLDD